jgi:hypothetical protein
MAALLALSKAGIADKPTLGALHGLFNTPQAAFPTAEGILAKSSDRAKRFE